MCHGSFNINGLKHIVLDLCTNGSLEDILQYRGHLTHPEVRIYTLQLLSGLQCIHSHGLMHRDIKPANILFDEEMTLKIADFGLGAQLVRGQLCRGTLRYMAPELIESKEEYTQSVDLWSAGVVM